MNIVVRPYGSKGCYCRPDTTWERENRDFYVPEGIEEVRWAPVVFVRVSKAGKCVGAKFAERYYDSFNFGALLYCVGQDGESSVAFTSCADHSSILPSPLNKLELMETEENIYQVSRNAEEVFSCNCINIKQMLEETLCTASKLTTLRIGDYVAVELLPAGTLATCKDADTRLHSRFCEKDLYDFKIVY